MRKGSSKVEKVIRHGTGWIIHYHGIGIDSPGKDMESRWWDSRALGVNMLHGVTGVYLNCMISIGLRCVLIIFIRER